MSTIGFYNGINLIETSCVASTNVEFNLEAIAREAQDLANGCACDIDAWTRDGEGEQSTHTGITATPIK
jgi:hypothetical protein